MHDIVYVVRKGESNEALRYSLRSLENIPHQKVWIAGHRPRWVRGVKHLPYNQAIGGPLQSSFNTSGALYRAAGHHGITPDFIYMNDDFFVMKPIEDLELYHRGPIEDHMPKWGGEYRRGALMTAQMMRYLGFNFTWSYELHIPMLLNRKKFVEIMDVAMRHGATTFRLHKRTAYANYWGLKGEYMADVKVKDPLAPVDTESTFLSTAPSTWHRAVGDYIRSQFPKKSRYES